MTTAPSAIEVRNLAFDLDPGRVPRRWHPRGQTVATFFDALSTFFPEGERFFIASVIAHRDRVTDPALEDRVRAFSGQEGIHGREHARYNAMLVAHGYPADVLEREVRDLLVRVKGRLPRRMRLAVTCALEHFTALMARALLGDPRVLEGAHPTMAAVWRWHAAEENEHRSVAFDVFLAAGGTWGERVSAMIGATVVFWAKVVEHQARMMRVDGTHRSPREWLGLARYCFVNPGVLTRILPDYLSYYLPGFHPDHVDTSALLERWREEQASPDAARHGR